MTGDPRTDIATRLRDETRAEHEAAEHDLQWESRVAEIGRYRALLERLHGFHRAFEPALDDALADAEFLLPRRKLPLLDRDLRALGLPAEALCALPVCPTMPPLHDAIDALGALYVLEGSTLGGQIIARRVARDLGLDAGAGCAYYAAYGADTGLMWRRFKQRLAAEAEGAPDAGDRMVAVARATFTALRHWLRDDARAEPAAALSPPGLASTARL